MPWFSMIGVAVSLLQQAPHLIDDFKRLLDSMHAVGPAPQHVVDAMPEELNWTPPG